MPLKPLDTLDDSDIRLVKILLKGIIEYPEIHPNLVIMQRSGRNEFSYFIGRHSGASQSPIPRPLKSPTSLMSPLIALGYAESTKQDSQFAFTHEALDWYRQPEPITNQEVQRRLGRYLDNQLHEYGWEYENKLIRFEEIAWAINVPLKQLQSNIRSLSAMGYVFGEWVEGDEEFVSVGSIGLTRPKGVAWANAGAPPIGPDGSPTINVTVNVTLRQIIQQAEHTGLSDQEKEQFAELMAQLSSEKKRGGNVLETVKNLLDITKNAKELWPSIAKFAIDHADDVGQMLSNLPHP